MEFKYIALICSVLLCLFLVFKEYQRPNKSWLIGRLLTTFFAIAGFLLLVFPIQYTIDRSVIQSEITWLTSGANPDRILDKNAKLLSTDSNLIQSLTKIKIDYIPDLSYYLAAHQEVHKINLIGEGLSLTELNDLKNYQIDFKAAAYPSGNAQCNWEREIKTSEPLLVQGNYINQTNKAVKLVLKGLGTPLDSVIIKAQSSLNFSLQNTPKQNGRAVYHLLALQAKDTLAKEAIYFEVIEKEPIKLLILASSPDFEYKFLKNWLFQNQYPVAFRTRISKDKFSLNFLNLSALKIGNINQSLLNNFDVVIADDEELANLSGAETAAINNQVANGLGLFIRLSTDKQQSVMAKKFSLYPFSDQKNQSYSFKLTGSEIKTKALQIDEPNNWIVQSDEQPLVKDENGKTWVNSKLYGSGKLIASTISKTFNWFLNGNANDYANFWSTVIGKAVQEKSVDNLINFEEDFLTVAHRININLQTNSEKTPNITAGNTQLAPLQNKQIPTNWQVTYWPKKAGWDSIKVNNDAARFFYINDKNSWETARTIQKTEQTLDFLKSQNNSISQVDETTEKEQREVSKWWFFLMFLLSAGFLWYESKRI
jgi:hypothetical protein